MTDHILFLTGHLARARLEKILGESGDLGFTWTVLDVGVKVAALMTEQIINRRLPRPVEANKVMLPGRCRGDLKNLSAEFGVQFIRGPDELKDLPSYFGRRSRNDDLSQHDMRIFAEIVDAPTLTIDAIIERAALMRAAGADVIDLGCLPDTPFPHLEDAVRALQANEHAVSVDSANTEELRRGALAGAQYLLSLTVDTLPLAAETSAVPILIPAAHGELLSLLQGNLLVVQVSPHTRRTIQEHDAARRIMFAARKDASIPKDYSNALLALHDRKPFPNTPTEIGEIAAEVKDPNFRIETSVDGIHVYNRNGHHLGQNAMSLFEKLGVNNDGAHAFYLGTELMKAEISWLLGKRYAQDEPLDWGCAADRPAEDLTRLAQAGHTLRMLKR